MVFMSSTYSCGNFPRVFPWKRLVWLVFITLYAALFFYNSLLSVSGRWLIYLYTLILILWLDTEYFERRLFFQSGLIPLEIYDHTVFLMLLRTGLALCFYASFITGLSTVIWWRRFQIGLYPLTTLAAIALLAAAVILRRRFHQQPPDQPGAVFHFHHSVSLILLSLALGYDSYLALALVVAAGLPMVYLQAVQEKKVRSEFLQFTARNDRPKSRNHAEDCSHWERFLETRSPRRKQ